MKSALKIFLLFLLLFVIISGLSIYWTYFKLIPSSDRTVTLSGLQQDVEVNWDAYQVPHINASRETDAFAVMGYIHARDRLWQMTRHQHKLEGLHTREFGESLLDLDRFYLTMAFGEQARQTYDQLSSREQTVLRAYANGINEYIENNRRHLPLEFTLGNANPITWEPWHAVGVQLLWKWQFQQSFWTKLALYPLQAAVDDTLTRQLTGMDIPHEVTFGNAPPDIDPDVNARLSRNFLSFTERVYPSRTGFHGTGFAVARQSPRPVSVVSMLQESKFTIPDQGYEIVVQVGDNRRSGITIPGFPVMIHGQNAFLAWSLHPLPADDGDFFSGELFSDPSDGPVNWKTDAGIIDILSDEITLERRILTMQSGAEYQLVTKKSHGRPVVAVSEDDNRYLAFDWSGLEIAADFGSYLALADARSIGDLENAVSRIQSPGIQVLTATQDGHAGRLTGGTTLTRTQPLKLRTPEDLSARMDASAPFPSVISSEGEPVFLLEQTADPANYITIFSPPWDRSQRYLELMEDTPAASFSQQASGGWNRDANSLFAATLTPVILQRLELAATDTLIAQVLPYLRNWNYEFRPTETAATLFEHFLHQASLNLYQQYFNDDQIRMLFTAPAIPLSAVSRLLQNPEEWPEDHHQTHLEWVTDSMKEVVHYLSETIGQQAYDWQWNHVMSHPFEPVFYEPTVSQNISARLASRNLYQMGDFSISGTSHTIRSSHVNYNNKTELSGLTTQERVMFLSPENKHYSILSTGQSGNVFSRHHDDQYLLWQKKELREQAFEPRQDETTFKHHQRFVP